MLRFFNIPTKQKKMSLDAPRRLPDNYKAERKKGGRTVHRLKEYAKKMLYPPVWCLAVLAAVSAAGLCFIFTAGADAKPNAAVYILYTLSAYTLLVWCLRAGRLIQKALLKLERFAFFRRYRHDLRFRAEVVLYATLGINVIYSIYEACAGIFLRSVWCGTLACYYIILSAERFLLVKNIRKEKSAANRWKKYRFCGILLLSLTAPICGMGVLMIQTGEAPHYPGHMIYAAGAYTFYNLAAAGVNVVKYHKRTGAVHAATKMLSLSCALVSLFSLQSAMLAAFGDDATFQFQMNSITCALLFAALGGMAVYMIAKGSKQIRRAQEAGAAEENTP